jgi:hypothetical protein
MIALSNVSVAATAPGGTLIGVIRVFDDNGHPVACSLKLISESSADGFFGIVQSSAHLVTTWQGSAAPGIYALGIQANAINTSFSDTAEFQISVA